MQADTSIRGKNAADYLAEAEQLATRTTTALLARPVAKVGVIGAGTMGRGIALACLYAGLDTVLIDQSREALDDCSRRIAADLLVQGERGRWPAEQSAERLSRLTATQDYAALADSDLVIESVFETMAIKQAVFRQLDAACRADCVLASNTSTLDLDAIASATARPQSVVGLHFFSPANVMRLLEIIRGGQTAPDVLATARAFAVQLGKVGVVVGNCFGFAGNRMIEGLVREVNMMLLEGAVPAQIDGVLKDFGYAMGPFAVADVVGLDVPYRSRQEVSQALPGDAAYCRMADLLVEQGRHGQKTGMGYYVYPDGPRHPRPDPEIARMAAEEARRLGIAQREIGTDEIVERCVLTVVNEGAAVLEEGIADRASDLDVIYTSGYGFPAGRGGPMAYADTLGLAAVLERVRGYHARYGDYWRPSDLLAELVKNGESFADHDARCGTEEFAP
ncbi:MAG: 3-hydroxyacyl-CoA dehydrogenase NAD-binding domain-containing protein [Sphingopyxis sp.]